MAAPAASGGGGQSSFEQMLAMKRTDSDSDSGGGGGGGGNHGGESGHGGAPGFSTPVFSDKIDILGGSHEDLLSSAAGSLDSAFGTLTGSVDLNFGGPFDHLITGSVEKGFDNLTLDTVGAGVSVGAGDHVNSAGRSTGMGATSPGGSGH
jgi:hypothetical protein